jgi:peptide chain release factor 1
MIDHDHLARVTARLPKLETELSQPGAAANPKRFQALVREHAALRRLAAKADAYLDAERGLAEHRELLNAADTDAELRELAAAEVEQLETELPRLERELLVALLPPDPDEARNAVFEIRAGTGGEEAALFAASLFRLYSRYAETRGWKIGVMDASDTELGGMKEVVFTVEGENVYRDLQYESGGHRVQRIPVTEASGRIHTSAATVAVFPEAEPDDDIDIRPDEIRVDIFRSSGPGGQSVNTTDSAVRITHLESGIVVQCQDEKSQHRNKERALKVLKSRLLDRRRQREAEAKGNKRRALTGSGDRSQRVRTYNFPQNRLTDHRINLTLYSLDRIMEGDIGEVIEALRAHDMELRLADELDQAATA